MNICIYNVYIHIYNKQNNPDLRVFVCVKANTKKSHDVVEPLQSQFDAHVSAKLDHPV